MTEHEQARHNLGQVIAEIANTRTNIERLSGARIESRAAQSHSEERLEKAEMLLEEQRQVLAVQRVDAVLGWEPKVTPDIARAETEIAKAREEMRDAEAYRAEILRREEALRASLSTLEGRRDRMANEVIETSPAMDRVLRDIEDAERRFVQAVADLRKLRVAGVSVQLERPVAPRPASLALQMIEARGGVHDSINVRVPLPDTEEWSAAREALLSDHNARLPGDAAPKRGLLRSVR